jgi:hypothetical protein
LLSFVVAPAMLFRLASLLFLLPLLFGSSLPLSILFRIQVALALFGGLAGLFGLLALPVVRGLALAGGVLVHFALALLGRSPSLLVLLPLPFGGRLPLALLVGLQVALALLGRPAVFFVPLSLPALGLFALAPLVGVDLALPFLGRPPLALHPLLLLVGPQCGCRDGQGEQSHKCDQVRELQHDGARRAKVEELLGREGFAVSTSRPVLPGRRAKFPDLSNPTTNAHRGIRNEWGVKTTSRAGELDGVAI